MRMKRWMNVSLRWVPVAIVLGLLYGGWAWGFMRVAPVTARKYDPKARRTLIAHEWGTVLNVQGSDGAIMDGLYFKKEWGVSDFSNHTGE